MTNAKVSIVICTCNGEKFLRRQLDTVLAQTFPLHEIIVQDDNSKDGTWAILQDYAAANPLIKLYRNMPALGVNGNFFSAMKRASGDFIALCDQDDIWEPDKTERQLAAIGDKMLCSCHSQPFSEDGAFAWYDSKMPNINIIRMLFTSLLPGHTMLIRKDMLNLLPPDDNPVYGIALYDSILGLIAAAYDSIAYVDRPLVKQRRHTDATTYSSYQRSLPSAGNAFYILGWSLRHYNAAKPFMQRVMRCRLALLDALDSKLPQFSEAKAIANLELKNGFGAYIRLTWHFVSDRKELFHSHGGGLVKVVRALLYPVMQMYNYRLWLK